MLPLPALVILIVSVAREGSFPDLQHVNIGFAAHQTQCIKGQPCDVTSQQAHNTDVLERAAKEKAAQEKATQLKAAQEKAAQEKAAQLKAAQEKAAQEKAAQEKAAQEKAALEKAAQEKVAQEKAAQEKAAQDKAAQLKAEQQKAAQEKAEQEKAKQDKAAQENVATQNTAQETDKKSPEEVPEPYEGDTRWTKEQLTSLDKHNELRKQHGAPSIGISKGLCIMATKHAKYLASIDKMVHTTLEGRQNTGENLYVEFGRKVNSGEGARSVQHWYDEIKDYDYSKPVFSLATGHFTQVVWHETKEVGVGVAVSATGKTYVVSNYWPGGNLKNQFESNVGKPV